MVPGEVYEITIELFPVANLFCRGHRLRLDISSSNFAHFDVNPNSGEPEGSWRRPRIARNRVFVGEPPLSPPAPCCPVGWLMTEFTSGPGLCVGRSTDPSNSFCLTD